MKWSIEVWLRNINFISQFNYIPDSLLFIETMFNTYKLRIFINYIEHFINSNKHLNLIIICVFDLGFDKLNNANYYEFHTQWNGDQKWCIDRILQINPFKQLEMSKTFPNKKNDIYIYINFQKQQVHWRFNLLQTMNDFDFNYFFLLFMNFQRNLLQWRRFTHNSNGKNI